MSLSRSPLSTYNQTPARPSPTSVFHFSKSPALMHKPSHSSPLAGSSPLSAHNDDDGGLDFDVDHNDFASSPTVAVQARRRAQYKSSPNVPTRTPRMPPLLLGFPRRPSGGVDLGPGAELGDDGDASQAAFLRTRLKKRCFERAAKARERAVNGKRTSMPSSDGFDVDEDMDDEEEDPLLDDLFLRIMRNQSRKMRRTYLHAYDREIGSSDPALEDPQEWEDELGNTYAHPPSTSTSAAPLDDTEERALQEYLAEEALAEFADIPPEELFGADDDLDWDDAMHMDVS
ncbi:hypothetical protein C8F01DRAFT_1064876 [Mycena amicta]|nr:hypothetical protein C8F01DRAFT_1064876 [Mycena amicta]